MQILTALIHVVISTKLSGVLAQAHLFTRLYSIITGHSSVTPSGTHSCILCVCLNSYMIHVHCESLFTCFSVNVFSFFLSCVTKVYSDQILVGAH